MIVYKNWLQKYFKNELPSIDDLAELFTFHAFEVEDSDQETSSEALDLKVLPDRAHYALSHRGIAKEIAVLLKADMIESYQPEIKPDNESTVNVKVENPKFCRRYIARVIELPKGQYHSPDWLKDSLEAIGQRTINPIVDITNYVMYDIGQPLHAFDADKVVDGLIIRNAKNGEKITLLDDREITLTDEDSVIADNEGPLVIAGAKGGKRAEIGQLTTRIIIESANFHPASVRKTSTKYDIRSDSSKRFENEITPELAIHGMNNTCKLIAEIYFGAKFGPIVDIYPKKAEQTVFEFDFGYLKERLGIEIPKEEAVEILNRLGIETENVECSTCNGYCLNLKIPFERLDLVSREDIVEEVGRIYGYDKVKGILPPKSSGDIKNSNSFYTTEKIKNILVDLGFSEVSLYTLVERGDIEIAKPLAKDKAFLRTNLSDNMSACVTKNALNADLLGLDTVKVFEIGHVFNTDTEEIHLAVGVAQVKKVKGLTASSIISETLKKMSEELGVDLEKGLEIKQNGNQAVAEVDLKPVIDSTKDNQFTFPMSDLGKRKYKKFSLYPFISRDIAVFVPDNINSEEVWVEIMKGIEKAKATELLVRHSLFDTFKKDSKTSYAFRMIFQSMERTLTDEETNKIMEEISLVMKDKGWVVR